MLRLTALILFVSCSAISGGSLLSQKEKDAGWQLLFDGKTFKGWKNYRAKDNKIKKGWSIKNNTLHLEGSDIEGFSKEAYKGGDLMTIKTYKDFELKLQWKISPKGNSGVIVRADESGIKPWMSGIEMQILDNSKAKGKKSAVIAGAIYGLVRVDRSIARPAGEWQDVHIIAKGTHYQFWLNGHKTADFDVSSAEWKEKVKKSKFKNMPVFGQKLEGSICLQDHTDGVSFRNIKIKEL